MVVNYCVLIQLSDTYFTLRFWLRLPHKWDNMNIMEKKKEKNNILLSLTLISNRVNTQSPTHVHIQTLSVSISAPCKGFSAPTMTHPLHAFQHQHSQTHWGSCFETHHHFTVFLLVQVSNNTNRRDSVKTRVVAEAFIWLDWRESKAFIWGR